MIRYIFTKQFLGFLTVGGLAAFIHWGARIILSLWLSYSLAIIIAYIIGMMTAFLLNRIFVFKRSNRTLAQQAKGFIWINLLFFPVVWFAAVKINDGLNNFGLYSYSKEIAHGIAVAVPMIATFLFYKLIAFRDINNER